MIQRLALFIFFTLGFSLIGRLCIAQNQDQNHFIEIYKNSGNFYGVIKEGKFIKVTANQKIISGKLHILNDSLIELNSTVVNISSLTKLRVRHNFSKIVVAGISGIIGAEALFGIGLLISDPTALGVAGSVQLSLVFIAIGIPAISICLKNIKNSRGLNCKDYKIKIII